MWRLTHNVRTVTRLVETPSGQTKLNQMMQPYFTGNRRDVGATRSKAGRHADGSIVRGAREEIDKLRDGAETLQLGCGAALREWRWWNVPEHGHPQDFWWVCSQVQNVADPGCLQNNKEPNTDHFAGYTVWSKKKALWKKRANWIRTESRTTYSTTRLRS